MLSSDSTKQLKDFFGSFPISKHKKGDIVIEAENIPTPILFITSGYVKVYRISAEGEELTLAILKSGDILPLNLGLQNSPNYYYYEAITSLRVFKTPQEQFINYLKQNPEVFYNLTGALLDRFGGLLTRMEYLIYSSAYNKVASTLLICAKRFGRALDSGVLLNILLTHKDIANLAGITRETTCLEMKKLEKKGLVSRKGRLFVVRNLKRLEEESLLSHKEGYILSQAL